MLPLMQEMLKKITLSFYVADDKITKAYNICINVIFNLLTFHLELSTRQR